MKRQLVYLVIAIGLIPWTWVLSYVGFREFNAHGISPGGTRVVQLPTWAEPMEPSYESLARADQKLTGTLVVFGQVEGCWSE